MSAQTATDLPAGTKWAPPPAKPEHPAMDPKDKLLFGKREAAALLSIGMRTLDRLLAADRIRHKRVGKKILISRAEIEKFAKGGDVETGPKGAG